MKLRFRKWVYGNISLRRSATEWSISLRKIRPLQVQNGHSAPKIFFISKTISLPYLEIWMSYVNILSTSHRSKIFHPAFWRSAPLYYFPTLLRGASQRYRTSPLRSLALRTAQINSHTAQILSTRANILWNRFTAPRAISHWRFAPLQYLPTPHRRIATLHYFPTLLGWASCRDKIFLRLSAVPNIPLAAPQQKNTSGCIVTPYTL